MSLEFTCESPYRIAAFGKYYAAEHTAGRVFDTVDSARLHTAGEWLCAVQFLGRDLFFVRLDFSIEGYVGAVFGRWNELRLIEKCL